MNQPLSIFVDGGSRGNPGLSACAFVVINSQKHELVREAHLLGIVTNNVAEYKGVIMALDWVLNHLDELKKIATQINFNLDSQLIVNQINMKFRVKENHLQKLHSEVLGKIKSVGIPIYFHQIPRSQNSTADLLLNQLLDRI